MAEQERLLEMPEQPARAERKSEDGECKLRWVNREQLMMTQIDVEHLIDEQHPARGIWDVTAELDLSQFEEGIRSRRGEAGRAAWPPRLLIALWLYSYSQGITSARELERRMAYEPGLMWLTGMEVINHHTLSDFRSSHGLALTDLFTKMLVVLSDAGLVKLELVAHDGTKIRAQAGVDSFRREATLREKLERARELVSEDPQAESSGRRQQAARERARRERAARAAAALVELEKLQGACADEEKQQSLRVSQSEPEARWMKHGDHALVPSYNAQISTDADSGVIVGVRLGESSSDAHELEASIHEIQRNLNRLPKRVVADGGFTNLQTIQVMANAKLDFYGSLADPQERTVSAMKSAGIDPQFAPRFFILQPESNQLICPAGCFLPYVRTSQKRGLPYAVYQAAGADCLACVHQQRCCPRAATNGRSVSFKLEEPDAISAFRHKMETEEARKIYQRRGPTAEFPFAWIKERMRLRKFRLFGVRKAGLEMLWATLAYNVGIWMRKVWRAPVAA
jgi:transposase